MRTPNLGRWRVIARTTAGHTVVLADHLDEPEARDLYDECSAALQHLCTYGFGDASHILTGQVGTVRLDAVVAVQIGYDRTVTR